MARAYPPQEKPRITRKRPQLSCNECRASRRKCDRGVPCGRCAKLGIECTFVSNTSVSSRVSAPSTHSNGTLSHQADTAENSPNSSTGPSFISSEASFAHTDTPHSTLNHDFSSQSDQHQSRHQKILPKDATFDNLLCHAPFLSHCLEVFFTFQDHSSHLLESTCIHRLSRTALSHPIITGSTDKFDPIRVLSLAMVCLVAQMQPTTIQSALILLPSSLRRSWPTSQDVELAAYAEANASFDHTSISPSDWSAEHFAAFMLLRLYDKHCGKLDRCGNGVILNAARLQLAGLHRWPRIINTSSFINVNRGYASEEDKLLSYRVFWEAFDKERITCWFRGWGYSIQARHSNMCLRDAFGHATIQQLTDIDSRDPLEYDENSHCSCLLSGAPYLTAYAGAHARIGALSGRLYDRMGAFVTGKRSDHDQVELFAKEAGSSLALLESRIMELSNRDQIAMTKGQADAMILIIAQIRCGVARRLFEVYAARLEEQGESRLKAEGLLRRGELDAAVALIDKATQMTSKSDSVSLNRIIMPKFVFQQVTQVLDTLYNWFRWDPRRKYLLEGESEESRRYLLECLRKALIGRNLLVLLARKSDLRHVQECALQLTLHFKHFFDKILSPNMIDECGNVNGLVDEEQLIEELESYNDKRSTYSMSTYSTNTLSDISNEALITSWDSIIPEPLPALFTNEELDSLLAGLPELDQLLQAV